MQKKQYDEKEKLMIFGTKFAKNNLYGIEINDQIARICKMNMIIHDDGHTNVISADSLTFFKDIRVDCTKEFTKDKGFLYYWRIHHWCQ